MISVKFRKSTFEDHDERGREMIADFSAATERELVEFERKHNTGINFDSNEIIDGIYTAEAFIPFEYGRMEQTKKEIRESVAEFNAEQLF